MMQSALNRTCAPAAVLPASRASRQQRRSLKVRAGDPAAPDTKEVPQNVLDYAKTMPGVCAPFPNIFDPLNFLGQEGAVNNRIREVRRWRESEVTHGRVAMLATLGFIMQEYVQKSDVRPFPNVKGPAIIHFQQVESKGTVFWAPLVLAIGLAEAYRVGRGWKDPSDQVYALRDDYEPGNLGFDPLGLLPDDPKERYDMQTKELNNGRLAMIAIVAFVVQELLEPRDIVSITAERLPGGSA